LARRVSGLMIASGGASAGAGGGPDWYLGSWENK